MADIWIMDSRSYHLLHLYSHILSLRVMLGRSIGSGMPCQESRSIYHSFRVERFLRDLKKTATLTSGQRVAAGAVGVLVPGIFTGQFLRFFLLLERIHLLDRHICCKCHQKVDENKKEQTCGRAGR